MAPLPHLLLLSLTISAVTTTISAHNITAILEGMPEYSQFNSFLSQTKLADEINSRETITVLALNNAAMSSITSNHPISVIKNALSLLVLLDYYDPSKLHDISNGTTLSTTLYQTTGNVPGNLGFVNITDLKGGKVGFGSAAPGSKLDTTYTKPVKQIPYNISVLEVSAPIIAPGVLSAPAPSSSAVNLTGVLEKAGCKIFAGLLASSGVLKTYESSLDKGLTVFAPNDEAFKAKGVPDLKKLTNADVVSLLQYHASNSYTPSGTLKTKKDPITTLASNAAGKYDIDVTTSGDEVTLHTGVGSSRVADTILDSMPVVIFSVDNVLLPQELFGKAPSPAPAAVPVSSPSPSPAVEAPSPLAASPPAPPMETPGGAPADAPVAAEKSTSDNNAAAGLTGGVLLLFASVVSTVLMV